MLQVPLKIGSYFCVGPKAEFTLVSILGPVEEHGSGLSVCDIGDVFSHPVCGARSR
jgi:hypothetical protein